MIEVILIGIGAGILAGMFGIGGGVLFVPALTLLVGLSQVTAEGTSLLAMIPVGIVGVWSQHRRGLVEVRNVMWIGLLSVFGVVAGVLLANHLPEQVLRKIFGVFLLLIAFRLLRQAISGRRARLAQVGSD
jgi:uncharacterized membrane protein YfcA